ncbi:uncharacterized protein LOC125942593 [Dermacentor silvarum]|uniref:uncharacterized protein LOC125942593 n=1 Tax=Dermacentor silvarum TaxID=543639 RepID=UPI0021018CDB|nr:uncharacterized protein LOC125942593 [Dermacentor silvarum]
MTLTCNSFQGSSLSSPTCFREPQAGKQVTPTATTWKSTQMTPMEGTPSPAEVLQGRRLRTTLPDVRAVQELQGRKHCQSNTWKRTLVPLGAGDTVRAKTGSWATKAQVLKPCNTPGLYHVVTEEGKVLCRNRQHLLPTGETF